jgi:hypothetical protein
MSQSTTIVRRAGGKPPPDRDLGRGGDRAGQDLGEHVLADVGAGPGRDGLLLLGGDLQVLAADGL